MGIFKKYTNRMVWLSMSVFAALFMGCSSSDSSGATAASAVAPTVISTVPDNNATAVPDNRKITATFSTAMDAATLTASTFTLADDDGAVTGSVAYYGKIAVFTPDTNLTAGLHTATITTGAKNLAGTALAANYVWTFTVGVVQDTTAPDVNATTPLNLATGVAINRNITATFNEHMDPADINTTTFTLTTAAGAQVAGVVSYIGTTATFNPTVDLNISEDYNATITNSVKDLAGNAMLVNYVWTFQTGTVVAAGPDPVNLGTAINYAILAQTGVSTVPNSVVTGNVGVSPAARGALTGWDLTYDVTDTYATSTQVVAPFKLYASDLVGGTTSADLSTAVLNMQAAYTDAAGRTATSAATTNVGSGTLTSLTLAPGVYEWGSAVTIPTDLTFTGTATDVWILKVAGTLNMAANQEVILGGGALAKNIFWQVSGAVTIGAGTEFKGIVLGQTAITMGNLSTIEGRLLAQTAVTLDQTTVTQPAP
ncbi:MAG: ice-binding family protein [Sulfuricurvum sp.]|nr:ice-binding family protein [Sulfuricurvum sp.]